MIYLSIHNIKIYLYVTVLEAGRSWGGRLGQGEVCAEHQQLGERLADLHHRFIKIREAKEAN